MLLDQDSDESPAGEPVTWWLTVSDLSETPWISGVPPAPRLGLEYHPRTGEDQEPISLIK